MLLLFSSTARSQAQREIRIVAFGASQTEGKIVSPRDAYPAQLERRLAAEGYNVKIRNAGISGDTGEDMLKRVERDVPADTQIVIFQPGTNDCGKRQRTNEVEFRDNLRSLMTVFQKHRFRVLVIGGDCHESVQATVPAEFGATYYGKFGAGLAAFPRPDGQHFNAAGYTRFVELILPTVKELIAMLPH